MALLGRSGTIHRRVALVGSNTPGALPLLPGAGLVLAAGPRGSQRVRGGGAGGLCSGLCAYALAAQSACSLPISPYISLSNSHIFISLSNSSIHLSTHPPIHLLNTIRPQVYDDDGREFLLDVLGCSGLPPRDRDRDRDEGAPAEGAAAVVAGTAGVGSGGKRPPPSRVDPIVLVYW